MVLLFQAHASFFEMLMRFLILLCFAFNFSASFVVAQNQSINQISIHTPKASIVKRGQIICNNCQNGLCNEDGECSCLPGWKLAKDTCSQCAPSFFMATESTGKTTSSNCQVCQLGCSECRDDSGYCDSCYEGFTRDLYDETNSKCKASPTVTKNSSCPDGNYSNGEICKKCQSPCSNCNGPSKGDCTSCDNESSMFEGNCVPVNPGNGICKGTKGMIVNLEKKRMCDTCPSNCTACEIPDYDSYSSTIDQAKCTSCLPGSVLSDGKCEALICSKGEFVSGSSCQACSSACSTCAKDPDNCLSCPKGKVLSGSSCKARSSSSSSGFTARNRLASDKWVFRPMYWAMGKS